MKKFEEQSNSVLQMLNFRVFIKQSASSLISAESHPLSKICALILVLHMSALLPTLTLVRSALSRGTTRSDSTGATEGLNICVLYFILSPSLPSSNHSGDILRALRRCVIVSNGHTRSFKNSSGTMAWLTCMTMYSAVRLISTWSLRTRSSKTTYCSCYRLTVRSYTRAKTLTAGFIYGSYSTCPPNIATKRNTFFRGRSFLVPKSRRSSTHFSSQAYTTSLPYSRRDFASGTHPKIMNLFHGSSCFSHVLMALGC